MYVFGMIAQLYYFVYMFVLYIGEKSKMSSFQNSLCYVSSLVGFLDITFRKASIHVIMFSHFDGLCLYTEMLLFCYDPLKITMSWPCYHMC